jgi:uroporphyrinogen decarboxylase
MTHDHWNTLISIVNGEQIKLPQTGFLIDSPWLPGWYGVSNLDYYSNDEIWFNANMKAIETFPDTIFLPGFWSEYGMCTEPSAFGAKLVWSQNNLPHAEKIISSVDDLPNIKKPNVKTDGLLPFMINRLKKNENKINDAGHSIRFAIARGPLNIASFLMGTTEFMMAIAMDREKVQVFLKTITGFILDWISFQKDSFNDIEGILILDDLVGFIGEDDFKELALPHLQTIFNHFDTRVRFFHNDANGLVCAPYLKDAGINLFNFGFEHPIAEMKELVGNSVALLGNIPPRDILSQGSREQIMESVSEMMSSVKNKSGILWSCGGGMPQNVSTENIKTFINSVDTF